MKRRATVAVVLGGALVSGLYGITTPKQSLTPQDHGDLRRAVVDRALAAGDLAAAQRAWHDMYVQALAGRDWQELVSAADTELLIMRRAGAHSNDADPRARELYLAALFRAHAQGSQDGVLRVAQRFAAVGDREAAAMALRLVDTTAPQPAAAVATTLPDTLD